MYSANAGVFIRTVVSIATAAGFMLEATQARGEIACPDQLSVQQRAETPSGWAASYSEEPPRLSGVMIFDGPPANRVLLKYDKQKTTARELVQTWTLGSSPRSYYLQCSYERTTARITTPLPPGVRACEVVFDRSVAHPGGALAVKRMVCS